MQSSLLDTKLFDAINECDAESVKEFLLAGANMNVKDDSGQAPLIYAARMGYVEECKFLINSGAFVTTKGYSEKAAFDLASKFNRTQVADFLRPLITPERELIEYILISDDIENEIF